MRLSSRTTLTSSVSSVVLHNKNKWAEEDSNPRLLPREGSALPTELSALIRILAEHPHAINPSYNHEVTKTQRTQFTTEDTEITEPKTLPRRQKDSKGLKATLDNSKKIFIELNTWIPLCLRVFVMEKHRRPLWLSRSGRVANSGHGDKERFPPVLELVLKIGIHLRVLAPSWWVPVAL